VCLGDKFSIECLQETIAGLVLQSWSLGASRPLFCGLDLGLLVLAGVVLVFLHLGLVASGLGHGLGLDTHN